MNLYFVFILSNIFHYICSAALEQSLLVSGCCVLCNVLVCKIWDIFKHAQSYPVYQGHMALYKSSTETSSLSSSSSSSSSSMILIILLSMWGWHVFVLWWETQFYVQMSLHLQMCSCSCEIIISMYGIMLIQGEIKYENIFELDTKSDTKLWISWSII